MEFGFYSVHERSRESELDDNKLSDNQQQDSINTRKLLSCHVLISQEFMKMTAMTALSGQ